MKTFTFNLISVVKATQATITVKELSESLARKEANKRARKLGYILIF